MFLATRITASIQAFIVLIFVCSVCLSPQISEPILTQDQLPPPPLDVPTFLTLAQTLTQTSFGLQQDAFQDWLEALDYNLSEKLFQPDWLFRLFAKRRKGWHCYWLSVAIDLGLNF